MIAETKPYISIGSHKPASWSSGNAFVSGAGDPRFNLGPVKTNTVLPTACHRCDISLKGAVLPGRNEAEVGPVNSLDAST